MLDVSDLSVADSLWGELSSLSVAWVAGGQLLAEPVAELVGARIDDHDSGVDCSVTSGTESDEVFVVGGSAVGPEHDVVDVDDGVGAAGCCALSVLLGGDLGALAAAG